MEYLDDEDYNHYNEDNDSFDIRASLGFHDHASESAEFLNNFISLYIPLDAQWKVSLREWVFEWTGLRISISNEGGFSVTADSRVMPRKRLDLLRAQLRNQLRQAFLEQTWCTTSFGVMLLQLVEEADCHIHDFLDSHIAKKQQKGWNAASVSGWVATLDNPYGVDLLTVNDTAKFLLGQTIADICKDITNGLRILHVEPVFRADLVNRFLERRKSLKSQLLRLSYNQLRACVGYDQMKSDNIENSHEGLAEYLSTPKASFHGAPRHLVSSIVRHGFLIPGTKIGNTDGTVQTSAGASYGVGIYSSPSLEYASFYGRWTPGSVTSVAFQNPATVPGFRIVVCAVLMGRSLQVTREEAWRKPGLLHELAHSHVSPNMLEYVVFDTAQIVPCYVLHVDYGSEDAQEWINQKMKDTDAIGRSNGKRTQKLTVNLDAWGDDVDCPGAKKAKKEALKAAAAKWFPYGFGPAAGSNFVIEEIGEISDDEEDYGEFQAIRAEQGNEIKEHYQRADESTSWFDEYQAVRKTKKEVQSCER